MQTMWGWPNDSPCSACKDQSKGYLGLGFGLRLGLSNQTQNEEARLSVTGAQSKRPTCGRPSMAAPAWSVGSK